MPCYPQTSLHHNSYRDIRTRGLWKKDVLHGEVRHQKYVRNSYLSRTVKNYFCLITLARSDYLFLQLVCNWYFHLLLFLFFFFSFIRQAPPFLINCIVGEWEQPLTGSQETGSSSGSDPQLASGMSFTSLDLDFCGCIVREPDWISLSIKCDTQEKVGLENSAYSPLFSATYHEHGRPSRRNFIFGLTKNKLL